MKKIKLTLTKIKHWPAGFTVCQNQINPLPINLIFAAFLRANMLNFKEVDSKTNN